MTFVATLEAVTQAGGVPVVADIQESDLNLDPDAAAAATSGRTRFVLPVHLYGQLADMGRLASLGLPLIEDACQAPGAVRDGLRAGTGGARGGVQLLPREEPRRHGGRRSARDRQRRARRSGARAARARAAAEVRARDGGVHRAARHGSGRRPAPQAAAARALERREAVDRGAVPRSAGGRRRSPASSGSGGQRARLASLRRPDARPGPARGATSPSAASSRAATIPARFISPGRTRTSGWPRGASPWRKPSPASASRSRSSPACARTRSSVSSRP